jgi:hypothetical protein
MTGGRAEASTQVMHSPVSVRTQRISSRGREAFSSQVVVFIAGHDLPCERQRP